MTYKEILTEAQRRLEQEKITDAGMDARLLLEYVCRVDRNFLFVHGEDDFPEDGEGRKKRERFLELIEKRSKHVPLQHLTGTQCFMGLDFCVDENVLIPRQDTEILVEEVLRELHDGMRILDLCTGSGCIIVSLLAYSNGCRGVGADLSKKALRIALKNAETLLKDRCKVNGIAENDLFFADEQGKNGFSQEAEIFFIEGDLFDKITQKYDVIVSNPPYIKSDVISTLMPEVREHDPLLALDGGEDGLIFYRRIIQEAAAHLNGGGKLYFEIGFDQAKDVKKLMEQAGFWGITVVKDYAGLDRVVYGTHL